MKVIVSGNGKTELLGILERLASEVDITILEEEPETDLDEGIVVIKTESGTDTFLTEDMLDAFEKISFTEESNTTTEEALSELKVHTESCDMLFLTCRNNTYIQKEKDKTKARSPPQIIQPLLITRLGSGCIIILGDNSPSGMSGLKKAGRLPAFRYLLCDRSCGLLRSCG